MLTKLPLTTLPPRTMLNASTATSLFTHASAFAYDMKTSIQQDRLIKPLQIVYLHLR